MIKKFQIILPGALALAMTALSGGAPSSTANAQVFERAVQGAIGGAVIGGVVRGKRGIGTGAAIGAATGAVVGAVERDRRRKYRKRRAARRAGVRTHRVSRHDPLVYDTQSRLTQLGYAPGPIDGAYGNQTGSAIAEYQKENGLLVTGTPSDALLVHMNRPGG